MCFCCLFTGLPPRPEEELEVWAGKEVQSMKNIRSPNNDILYIIFIYDTSLFLAIILNINVKVRRRCFTSMIQLWFQIHERSYDLMKGASVSFMFTVHHKYMCIMTTFWYLLDHSIYVVGCFKMDAFLFVNIGQICTCTFKFYLGPRVWSSWLEIFKNMMFYTLMCKLQVMP